MPSTASFIAQHDELLVLAGKLSEQLDEQLLAKDASEARAILTKILSALTVHLSMEDRVLYPTLAKSPNEQVRETAVRFAQEMGGIGEAVNAYKAAWPTAGRIQENPAEFISQSQGILGALGARIEKENTQLYPLMEKM